MRDKPIPSGYLDIDAKRLAEWKIEERAAIALKFAVALAHASAMIEKGFVNAPPLMAGAFQLADNFILVRDGAK